MAIQTFELNNGMKVVLEENHAAKVVSFNALVKVGSAFETDEEAGICHVIEHMLFKGTPTRPTGLIARDVEAAGGDINAYTSLDQTVFYINMATRFADKGLEILADAIKNPLFDGEELSREAEVILEEMRRELDNPSRVVSEELFRTAYKVHPYGRPIIGYEKTVKGFTHDDLVRFYNKWYVPENIVFIAVGDFETKKMLEQIADHFKDFKGSPTPIVGIPTEPEQDCERLEIKPMNVQSSYIALGFHIPEISHDDVPALDLLSYILGGSESSRLEQEVKEKKRLVHGISSSAYTPKFPGMFYIGAMANDPMLPKALTAIKEEVERLFDEPVSSRELAGAKITLRSNEIYEKETVGGQAGKIASFISAAGSYEFEKKYYQMINDTTVEDLRRVAKKYLVFKNSSMTVVVPHGSKWIKDGKKLIAAISEPKAKKVFKKTNGDDGYIKTKLSNGATLLIRENHNLPIMSITCTSLFGLRSETKATNGISSLVARLLTKGTKNRTAVKISTDAEKMAGRIDGFSGKNAIGVRAEFFSEHLQEGLDLFADVLCNPAFNEKEIKNEKQLVLQAIKDQEDVLSSLAFSKFLETLFPNHPYGLRQLGTVKSVKAITKNMLVKFHAKATSAQNLVISVVGDVNATEVKNILEEKLARLKKGKASTLNIRQESKPKSPREVFIEKKDKQQSHIVLGFQGTKFTASDRYAMAVLNNILSGQGGRLFRILRDQMSLAYAVNSVMQEGVEHGFFAVYIGTDPSKTETAIKAIKTELLRITKEPVASEELMRAKQYLVGTYDLELQKNDSWSSTLAFHELYKIKLSEIEQYPARILSVTADDVLAAAKRYINIDAYAMSVVRPKS